MGENTNTTLPTVGRILHYRLSEANATEINRRREDYGKPRGAADWPLGAQAHVGNHASAGDIVPFIVVVVWPHEYGENVPGVNGQAILDGNDSLWITSAMEGTEPGTWSWPMRA